MNRFLYLLLIAVMIFAPVTGISGGRGIKFVWSNGRRCLSMRDIASFYGMKYYADTKKAYLNSKNSHFSFVLNKRGAVLNGTNAVTMFPVISGGFDSYISEHDFRYVLEPLVRPHMIPRCTVRTIVIDPGHGGQDKGAPCANGSTEKVATLKMAKKVAVLLKSRGFKVYLTRDKDRTLTLDQRVVMSNKIKPDLFISIHCNAAAKHIDGIETFAATPCGAPSSSDSKPGNTPTASDKTKMQNYRLAYEIQTSLRKNVKAPDRGVKHARFYVIRNAECPAVLIETGFVSNPYECSRIFTEWGSNQIAGSIVNGILSYCRIVR